MIARFPIQFRGALRRPLCTEAASTSARVVSMPARVVSMPARVAPSLVLAAAIFAVSACASGDRERSGLFESYRISIPQGNYVNQQMLDQVRAGMSREQVRLAIGSPLLTDPFHPDRWDYVFRFQYPNGEAELRRVRIDFKADRVAEVTADPLPQRDDPDDPALPGYRKKADRS